MPKPLRFSARTIALAYIVVSLLVLAMFAAPLWYHWENNIQQFRTDLLKSDNRRLSNLFFKHGAGATAAAIEAQTSGADEGVGKLMLFTDARYVKLAGNVAAWPQGVPPPNGVRTATITSFCTCGP